MTFYALRMDDVGASSKEFEVYSKKFFGFGNFLNLKYMKYFKAWGVYQELEPNIWNEIFELLDKNNAQLTIGVTGSWVNKNGELIPFYEKFPKIVDILSIGIKSDLIEIANHGLTHCVLENKKFLPKLFTSNRKYHREFWSYLPQEIHYEHLEKSQNILNKAFGKAPLIFIPPGNVFSNVTLDAAIKYGIKIVNCNTKTLCYKSIRIIGNERVNAFHDKEISEYGVEYIKKILELKKDRSIFISRLVNEYNI